MLFALTAAATLAVAMTAGDMLWAGLSLRHRMGYGLAHGALVCLLIGGFVGRRCGRTAAGLAAGLPIGLLAAGLFYALAPWLRYSAMFPAWMFFWVLFALLQAHLAGGESWRAALGRGLVAALISGVAFYLISGVWTRPGAGSARYLYHLGAWFIAFLPGFAALFLARAHAGSSGTAHAG